MRFILIPFFALGCAGQVPPPAPTYTPDEIECLATAEAKAVAGLVLCGRGDPRACPKDQRDEIEATQVQEVQSCLEPS